MHPLTLGKITPAIERTKRKPKYLLKSNIGGGGWGFINRHIQLQPAGKGVLKILLFSYYYV